MKASKIIRLLAVILMICFVASCALKIPPYIEPPIPVVIVVPDFYVAGLYYNGTNNVPSYWLNDQKVSCDGVPSTYLYPSEPLLAVDGSNDMFMAFYEIDGSQAGICINSTYNEFSLPLNETAPSQPHAVDDAYMGTINGIAESNGEIYVVGNVNRNQIDCAGIQYYDNSFNCATLWRSSTNYTPEFLPIDTGVLPNVRDITASSIYVDNGHVYVLASVSNHDGSWDVGYWLDGVFHKQKSLFSGVSGLYWIDPYQIKVINGVVYESGLYNTSDGKTHAFYLKDGTLSVISGIIGTATSSLYLYGMQILNDTVYIAANTYNTLGISTAYLISGSTVTTLNAKDSTYYSTAYGLGTDNYNNVVYVVGTITSKTTSATKGAIWSTNSEPKFYDNVAEFSSIIVK